MPYLTQLPTRLIIVFCLGFIVSCLSFPGETGASDVASRKLLESSLRGEHRVTANRARDKYRRPIETLLFFGLRPNSSVVEITPGRGWYTEVLAPFLKEKGVLTAVIYDANLTDNHPVRK